MRLRPFFAALPILLATPALAQDPGALPSEPAPPTPPETEETMGIPLAGFAELIGVDGKAAGTVMVKDGPAGILIRVEATGLTPGWHGMHAHEKGDCSDNAAGFKAAGAHAGHAEGLQHGLLNPKGPETGDLPNIHVAEDGSAKAEVFVAGIKLVDVIDGDGTSLMVHAAEDDHTSQPIGGSGDRVLCGVIKLAQ